MHSLFLTPNALIIIIFSIRPYRTNAIEQNPQLIRKTFKTSMIEFCQPVAKMRLLQRYS